MEAQLLRHIPNMNRLLYHPLLAGVDRERAKRAADAFLSELRRGLLSGEISAPPDLDECAAGILAKAEAESLPRLRRLINATGVVLHTNLGRAPLGREIGSGLADIAAGYCNLEYDLDTGRRGDRHTHTEGLVRELTGAEAAIAVNNNAAAVILMLSALARGKRVAVSRGEMVEIGGSFRVPEIMAQSGAELVEIGSTNRTRLSDYADAVETLGAEVLLKVHTSNYAIVGFAESVSPAAIAALARDKGLPALYDAGSCFLIEPGFIGLNAGESARSAVSSGMDVVCFSGDKLAGSAQAGLLAGRADSINTIKLHPLARAFRPDKLALSALEMSLSLYRYPDEARRRIPALAMLSAGAEDLRRRAETLAEALCLLCPEWDITVCAVTDEAGGGALPNSPLPGWAVAIKPKGISEGELEERLRRGKLPVILRVREGKALVSLRTLLPGEEDELIGAFREAIRP